MVFFLSHLSNDFPRLATGRPLRASKIFPQFSIKKPTRQKHSPLGNAAATSVRTVASDSGVRSEGICVRSSLAKRSVTSLRARMAAGETKRSVQNISYGKRYDPGFPFPTRDSFVTLAS